jgi:adenylate cyclase
MINRIEGHLLETTSTASRTEKIRSCLSAILASSEFSGKEKNCTLLKFLVEETLAGRADHLKQYTIGTTILNRPPDFNPDLDPIVRILAGRLRRSLNTYYEQEGREDPIRIEIPKGSYIPIFIDIRIDETDDHESKSVILEAGDSVRPVIAVQPLRNLTGDPGQAYFAGGFTQELIIELSRYEDFQVIISDESSVEADRNQVHDTGSADGARFIITGSVRKAEKTIKISIQLVDPASGEYIWGEQFRRDLTAANLLTIQEEIVYEIITNIAGEFGIIPRRLYYEGRKKPLPDLQTYDATLRFYHYQSNLSPETYLAAFQALEQAVARDPECGMACAMLADLYLNAFALDLTGGEDGREQAQELIRIAVQTEPENQLVRIISALRFFHLNQRSEFMREMSKAEALNPRSPLRLGSIGYFLALYGEWDKGKQMLDKAMAMNENYPSWYHGVTTLYYYRQAEYDLAYAHAVQYDLPDLFWTPLLRGACLGQLQRLEEAEEQMIHLLNLKPDFTGKAGILIRRFVKEEELVDHIMDGLQKAGLKTCDN